MNKGMVDRLARDFVGSDLARIDCTVSLSFAGNSATLSLFMEVPVGEVSLDKLTDLAQEYQRVTYKALLRVHQFFEDELSATGIKTEHREWVTGRQKIVGFQSRVEYRANVTTDENDLRSRLRSVDSVIGQEFNVTLEQR